MENHFQPDQLDEEILKRAREGSSDDALTALRSALIALGRHSFKSPYLFYLQECLEQVVSGVEPARAFGLEKSVKRGAPKKINDLEVMALDIYLRDHKGMAAEEAITAILAVLNIADRSTVQSLRRQYDSRYAGTRSRLMDQLSEDDLLSYLSPKVREKAV